MALFAQCTMQWGDLSQSRNWLLSMCIRKRSDEFFLSCRSYSGRCNNLEYPEKGGSFTELGRILPSEYNDRVSMPRSRSFILGQPLPNPRYVSEKLHERLDSPDREFSLMLMQWGQFIDHDMSLTPKYNGK